MAAATLLLGEVSGNTFVLNYDDVTLVSSSATLDCTLGAGSPTAFFKISGISLEQVTGSHGLTAQMTFSPALTLTHSTKGFVIPNIVNYGIGVQVDTSSLGI